RRSIGSLHEEPLAPDDFGRPRLARRERADGLPSLGRGDERHVLVLREIRAEIPGAPERADEVVAALALDAIRDVVDLVVVDRERMTLAREAKAQHRIARRAFDLVPAPGGTQRVLRELGPFH